MQPASTSTAQARRSDTAPGERKRARQRGAWRRFIPHIIVAALLAAIIAGLWPKPVEVETAAVHYGPLAVSVLEEGKTRIRHRYVISPPVSGFLNRVALRAGDRVTAGETILATIQAEPSSFLNPRARAEAEARVKGAEAARMRSNAELERARSALQLAEKDLARAEALKKTGAIATRDWDAAENLVAIRG